VRGVGVANHNIRGRQGVLVARRVPVEWVWCCVAALRCVLLMDLLWQVGSACHSTGVAGGGCLWQGACRLSGHGAAW